MSKVIYFDLDGTLYNLYGVPNWLKMLRSEQVYAYTCGENLFGNTFYHVINRLKEKGYSFGVITWLSKESTPEYDKRVTTAKKKWCKENLPFISSFAVQPYGTPKQEAIQRTSRIEILLDDNAEVCEMWTNNRRRKAYVIKDNLLLTLWGILKGNI